jgi:cyclophilin family peptidyl-prolyl cis-trans isomerase
MTRSRRFRKKQNEVKSKWGKNNPQNKKKNKRVLLTVGILAVAITAVSAFFLLNQNLFSVSSSSPSSSPTATPLTSPAGEYSITGARVLLETSMGNITIQLRDDKPITTSNFLNLTRQGLYDDTVFHRVIAGFMIQGGLIQNPNLAAISDEIGNDNHNYNGTIAMAKTSQPNSATSSFFINVNDNNNTTFDTTYTVFGQVIGGMDVATKISNVATGDSPYISSEKSLPLQNITLVRATILPQ